MQHSNNEGVTDMSRRFMMLMLAFLAIQAEATCYTNIPASTPTSHFIDNQNGTVTDTTTGLVWKRCAEGTIWNGTTCTGSMSTFRWSEALQYVVGYNATGGFLERTDWRLPNIKELNTLLELQCNFPAINVTVFPSTALPGSGLFTFWSNTPVVGGTGVVLQVFTYAWNSNFEDGTSWWGMRSNKNAVRLVRTN